MSSAAMSRTSETSDVHHDDARLVRPLRLGHPHLQTQVHHRDDLPTQVDDAIDVRQRPRNRRDLHHPDDLTDLEDLQAVLLPGQHEGQVLACLVLLGLGGFDHCLLCHVHALSRFSR